MDDRTYQAYVDILHEELVPAMGCTEPIAIAYAAALARDTLGATPDEVTLAVSGNIVKNVKSVVVPNTGGRKGMRGEVHPLLSLQHTSRNKRGGRNNRRGGHHPTRIHLLPSSFHCSTSPHYRDP